MSIQYNRRIGEYVTDKFKNTIFTAVPAFALPNGLKKMKKLAWDATVSQLRYVFKANDMVFFAPVITKVAPNELQYPHATRRTHTTLGVKFDLDFKIDRVWCADLNHRHILEVDYTGLEVFKDAEIKFEFSVEQYIQGKRCLMK